MKICLLFCLFFFLADTISLSQIGKVDSVLNEYNKCKIDTAKIDILLANSDFLIDADSKKLIEYSESALKLAKKNNDKLRSCLKTINHNPYCRQMHHCHRRVI